MAQHNPNEPLARWLVLRFGISSHNYCTAQFSSTLATSHCSSQVLHAPPPSGRVMVLLLTCPACGVLVRGQWWHSDAASDDPCAGELNRINKQ